MIRLGASKHAGWEPCPNTVPVESLRQILLRIDGRGYKAYKEIARTYQFAGFTLAVDSVQPDPFAAPSRLRALIPPTVAELPERLYANASRAIGVSCYLARAFARQADKLPAAPAAGGRSGEIRIEAPGPAGVGEHGGADPWRRNCGGAIYSRPAGPGQKSSGPAGLQSAPGGPAPDRRQQLMRPQPPPRDDLWLHAAVNEDADALRAMLAGRGLIAFVADGAILARSSGVDDGPLRDDAAVQFNTPDRLESFLCPAPRGDRAWHGHPCGR